ncbi:MAG: dihydroorotate dehydrogenase [Anaerolineae bacterium]|jgi:dihydroorotate dehydrogenase (NAD+) catalytic subunit|nr:dihydroorotate dehydrogenase [Chloroflexota bacterium]
MVHPEVPAVRDLSVDLAGVRLRNPLVLASGIWGSSPQTLLRAGRAGAGAVTSKSASVAPRKGHPNPTVLNWGSGLINAVGLTNPGAQAERELLLTVRDALRAAHTALIISVFGGVPGDFAEAVEILEPVQGDLVELNISCPNVHSEFGRPFALEPAAAAAVTRRVRAVHRGPLLVKLSPNTPDIVHVARAVVDAGADGLTAVNTLGPGMLIDVHARRPILANATGGVSGDAIRPIALRCVYELASVIDVPIIGTGGISTGLHALQMIMAGATAVGIGSALVEVGACVFERVLGELLLLMEELDITDLADVRGVAHV